MDRTLDEAQLNALVSLLDDRDPGVVEKCSQRLIKEGPDVLDALGTIPHEPETRWLRVQEITTAIRAGEAERDLCAWFIESSDELDLEEGALRLSRIRDPGLRLINTKRRLDELAEDLRTNLSNQRDATRPEVIAEALTQTLVRGAGLDGNRDDYYDPDNSFLDLVLERTVGIPISLSAVYILVSRRLGLPVFGVGMPGHFIVQCGIEGGDGSPVLIDPFDGGRVLTRQACLEFLARGGFGASDDFLAVSTDARTLARMIVNLVHCYRRLDRPDLEARYARLFELCAGEPPPA